MRGIVIALLLVGLALRVGFVLTMPHTPLYWDERHYHDWALIHQQFWSSLFGGGSGPSLMDAVRASREKGELFVAVVGVIYAIVGPQPRAVLYLHAVLDTLTCLLIFDLARAMAGVRAGLVALAIAVLYEPFIFSAARLQTETLSSLLFVAGLWAICVPHRRRGWSHFAGGALLAGAMLAKAALQYLLVFLLPAILATNWDRVWRERLRVGLLIAAGFVVVAAPHLLLSAIAVGRPTLAGTVDNSPDFYGGIIYENAGWKSDHVAFADPPRGVLLDVLGHDATRRPTHADYRAAAARTWTTRPLESAAVALHKLYVAWRWPYNDSRATLLFGDAVGAAFHGAMLCLALLGVPLALRRWRVALPVVAATAYVWLVYLSVKIETRYAVTAMPTMICFAGVAVAELTRGWWRAWRAGERRRLVGATVAAVILLALASIVTVDRALALLPISPEVANGLRVALIMGAIGACAYLTAELTRPVWRRSVAYAALAPSVAGAVLVLLAGRPLAQDWREWRSTLTPGRGVVGQEFPMPNGLRPPVGAALCIDMLPQFPRGTSDVVVVRVNGNEIRRYPGGPTRADANVPGDDYERLYEVRQPDGEASNAWYVIPISPELTVPGASVAVEVAVEGPDGDGALVVSGDYPPDATTYVGPSILSPRNDEDTSVTKYLADGDYRLRRRTQLSGAAHSQFYDGVAWTDRDLAFDSGRQEGRYRIFLVLAYDRGIVIM